MSDKLYIRKEICPELSPEQVITLVRLAEECSELAKSATKTLRFGFEAVGPDGTKYDNYRDILNEFRDVDEVMGDLNRIAP